MDRVAGVHNRFGIRTFLLLGGRLLLLLRGQVGTGLPGLLLAYRLVSRLSTAHCLHVVPLVQHLPCHLDILPFVRHDYDVVHQQVAELS